MSKRIDVPAGTVFGLLVVIEEAPTAGGRRAMLCQCKCGQQKVVELGHLRSGHSQSCGCITDGPMVNLSELKPGEVPLRGEKAAGRMALVDDEDYGLVMLYRWHVFEHARRGRMHGPYATAWIKDEDGRRREVWMHAFLMGWPLTDHIDGNGLNNHRSNLRAATNAQNLWNTGSRGGSSQFKGVHWYKRKGKWRAAIELNSKTKHLGYFADEVEAARAYDAAALRFHGEFACLNFPVSGNAA